MGFFRDAGALLKTIRERESGDENARRFDSDLLERSQIRYSELLAQFETVEVELSSEALLERCKHLCDQFQEQGAIADVDEAIRLLLNGRRTAKKRGETVSLSVVLQLGTAYVLRYEALNELNDFKDAEALLKALLEEPGCSSIEPDALQALGRLHATKYGEDDKLNFLDQAISYARRAVDLHCQHGGTDKLDPCLSDLAFYYGRRYEASKSCQDLDEALRLHIQAVAAYVSLKQPCIALRRYGRALRLRYEARNQAVDSELAERVLSTAISEAKIRKNQHIAAIVSELAELYAARYKATGNDPDLLESLRLYTSAAESTASPAKDRLSAATRGGSLAMKHGYAHSAFALYSRAINILPRLAWIGLDPRQRYTKLRRSTIHVSCNAAAAALAANKPEVAVELVEHGRSVLWRSVLDLRVEFSALEDLAPSLYDELKSVKPHLDSEIYNIHKPPAHAQEAVNQHRRRAAERWEQLLQQARKIPEFAALLKPRSFYQLREAAAGGPVVLLNISEYRSDALIITGGKGVQTVPLEGLGPQVCRQLAFSFEKAQRAAVDRAGCRFFEQTLRTILRQLWNGGIAAVARALVQLPSSNGTRQRVWWMTTDALSILPLHAAGPYEGEQPGLPDLFISSYTITLTSLVKARQDVRERTIALDRGLVAVLQPEVPGLSVLSTAPMEIDIVIKNSPFDFVIGMDKGFKDFWECTVKLPERMFWMHACAHGHWNPMSPMDSSVRFLDGALTLAHIIHLDFLDTAEFAFLSACHTARQSIVVPDEAMHLAAGLQIAGLKAVVATGWAMADSDGPKMAYWFYSKLKKQSPVSRVTDTAAALAGAVDEMRKTGAPIHRWAVFVHYGV